MINLGVQCLKVYDAKSSALSKYNRTTFFLAHYYRLYLNLFLVWVHSYGRIKMTQLSVGVWSEHDRGRGKLIYFACRSHQKCNSADGSSPTLSARWDTQDLYTPRRHSLDLPSFPLLQTRQFFHVNRESYGAVHKLCYAEGGRGGVWPSVTIQFFSYLSQSEF